MSNLVGVGMGPKNLGGR